MSSSDDELNQSIDELTLDETNIAVENLLKSDTSLRANRSSRRLHPIQSSPLSSTSSPQARRNRHSEPILQSTPRVTTRSQSGSNKNLLTPSVTAHADLSTQQDEPSPRSEPIESNDLNPNCPPTENLSQRRELQTPFKKVPELASAFHRQSWGKDRVAPSTCNGLLR